MLGLLCRLVVQVVSCPLLTVVPVNALNSRLGSMEPLPRPQLNGIYLTCKYQIVCTGIFTCLLRRENPSLQKQKSIFGLIVFAG